MKRTAASVVVMAVIAWVAVAARQGDPGIEKLVTGYQAAFNKADAKGIAALYTADALRVVPDGRLISGRAAIEKDYVTAFAGQLKGGKLTIHPGETRNLTPDVALSAGTYEVTGGSAVSKGRYVNTLKREGGQWLLASVVTIPEMSGTK